MNLVDFLRLDELAASCLDIELAIAPDEEAVWAEFPDRGFDRVRLNAE